MTSDVFNLDEMAQSGIALAKAGRRREARDLLVQLVEVDPNRELAWVWLSELMDTMEDRIIALENALALHPGYAPYEKRLAYLRAQPPRVDPERTQQNEDWMRQAAAALHEGDRARALALARHVVLQDPAVEKAWLLVSNLAPDVSEQVNALKQVVSLNPHNQRARSRLEDIEQLSAQPLLVGQRYEQDGDLDMALAMYNRVMEQGRTAEEKLEAAVRSEFATFYREFPEVKPLPPNTTLIRLTVGPILLYILLLLSESGLNPLHAPLLPLIGLLPVIFGSFLVVLTTNRPRHPLWIKTFGTPGLGEESTVRGLAKAAGWLMFLTPFVLLLVDSVERLTILASQLPLSN
jgi:tetratricopeptide (TPR) repeat protein